MIGKSKIKLDREVLFSIRCDQVYYYLKNNDYDYNALDDLIAYYSIEGETIKKMDGFLLLFLQLSSFPSGMKQ